ncbi:MAG: hypothetical protein IJA77_05905 [Clostridia bacterium]|nr:hypothetical protein [Clostridia bacterium]
MPILFQGRYDKQLKNIQEKNKDTQRVYDVEDVRNVLEKGDVAAMIISALLVIVPVALVFLVVISLIGFFFIVR